MNNKKKIKILRIINRFNIGGPTYNAVFLTKYLSEEFETLLIGGLPEESEADSLHILREYGVEARLLKEMKRKPSFFSDTKAYKEIKEIIKEFNPDIVHTHASKAGALGRKAAHYCKVPIIVHTFHGHVFHSYFGKIKTTIFKLIERYLAYKTTSIIAISDLQKKELSNEHKVCSPKKIEVISLGFDLTRFKENKTENRKKTRAKYNLKNEQVAVCITGRLVPIKNHDFFLKAVTDISKKTTKEVVFFIVGDGELNNEISLKTKTMKLQGIDIRMTSWVKKIHEFNAGMDIICLTSHNEGTPVSLIEAQASGLPVISTNVGGVLNVVKNNQTGFVIDKNDLDSYVEKLLVLIENKSLRDEFSSRGWDFVGEKFHFNALVKKTEKHYKDLLNKRR